MTTATGAPGDHVATPYLSVVAATRNDDHGGGLLARMQVFVDALIAQCERHQLDAELILVEWNPPADRAPLVDALRWPAGGGRVTVRVITVSPELHRRFAHAEALPLFQMIAKNVGIRRAGAPYVLATNIDLVLSDEVMHALAARTLAPRTLYRADRYDVDRGIPAEAPLDEQLRWCAGNLLRICGRLGTKEVATGAFYPIYAGLSDLPRYVIHRLSRVELGRGDFAGRAHRAIRRRLRRRLIEQRRLERHAAALAAGRPAAAALAAAAAPPSALRRLHSLARRSRVRPHTNASGDFTLLHRDDWERLRAYPELEIYSLHIDSLLLYMARFAGIRERVLPGPVYHLEHGTGFRPDDEGRRELFGWLDRAGIPWITGPQFDAYVMEMITTRRPLDLNDDAWGLGGEELPETRFVV